MTKKNDKTSVYLYTRVSTAMQVDGYSLDAQKAKMKAFCEFNNYGIAGEYAILENPSVGKYPTQLLYHGSVLVGG